MRYEKRDIELFLHGTQWRYNYLPTKSDICMNRLCIFSALSSGENGWYLLSDPRTGIIGINSHVTTYSPSHRCTRFICTTTLPRNTGTTQQYLTPCQGVDKTLGINTRAPEDNNNHDLLTIEQHQQQLNRKKADLKAGRGQI